MNQKNEHPLSLGPDVLRHLLPHRRPFLMVDAIDGYQRAPHPTLWASRFISSNEEVFSGHFPGLNLWPGVYTIEGLGQCCSLAILLSEVQRLWEEQGGDPEEPLTSLRNLEQGYRLRPGYRPELSKFLVEKLAGSGNRISLAAAVELKFLQPVFAGQRLQYRVEWTHTVGDMFRFAVEASVADKPVARGTVTGARPPAIPEPR